MILFFCFHCTLEITIKKIKKANWCYVTFVGLEIRYNAFMLNKLIRTRIRLVAVKGLALHFSPGKCECYLRQEASSMLFQSW